MRPIPAPRLGDAHGLLRAISQRERLRLDEFVTEFSVDELFPAGLENALGRTRQFVSFARAAGLLKEDRGVVELTEVGKRYVRAGDDAHFFDVSSGQAEWLRRQLRERHMTDSIFHGAAIGLSLLASSPSDFRVSNLDFGRALAYLARAGWDNDNTFSSQGERYGTFLRDLELVDERWRLTSIGDTTRAELTLPIHMSLKDLAAQLNPGGVEAAVAAGEAEWTAREASAGAAAAAALEHAPGPAGAPGAPWSAEASGAPGLAGEPGGGEPAVAAPRAQPVALAGEPVASGGDPVAPGVIDTGEYEDVGPGAGPSRLAAPPSQSRLAGVARADRTPASEPRAPASEPPGVGDAGSEVGGAGSGAGDAATGAGGAGLAGGAPVRPPVPDDVWDVATPDDATRDYRAVGAEPAQEAPAGASGPPPAGPTQEERRAAEAATRLSVQPASQDLAPGFESAPAPPLAPVPAPSPATPGTLAPAIGQPSAPAPQQPSAPAAQQPPAPGASPEPGRGAGASGFLDLAAVRAAAEEAGLRLPGSVYAAAVAALATGRHVVLTGPPGCGKTTLALALARAATAGGRAAGAVLVTPTRRSGAGDMLGRRTDAGFEAGHVLSAALRDRWLVLDELDRVHLDRALGALSTFLGGLPATLPDGSEAQPPRGWRIVATADSATPLRGSGALLRRFARVDVPAPGEAELSQLVESAAGGDAVAAAAARRLLGVRELRALGAGVFIAAARHAAERSALEPVGEAELARECLRAYVRPLLGDLDPDEEGRLRALVP